MTEKEYILLTNLIKIRAAINFLRDVMPPETHKERWRRSVVDLERMLSDLEDEIKIE